MKVLQLLTRGSARPLHGPMIYHGLRAKHLALFHIVLLSFWLLEVGGRDLSPLRQLDPAWYSPHGPWLLVPSPLLGLVFGSEALLWLKWATFLSVLLVLVGTWGRRLLTAVMLVLLLLFTSFLRGFGHPDHSHVQIFLVTAVLAFTPAWDVWSWSTRTRPRDGTVIAPAGYEAAFAAMAFVFSVPYFATGVYRLAKEGVWLYFGPSMLHFLARDSLALDDFDFGWGLWLTDHPALLPLINISFFLVTLAELSAPWAHLNRRFCMAFLAIILPFHLLSPLLMHILFLPNVLVLVALYGGPLVWQWIKAAEGRTR